MVRKKQTTFKAKKKKATARALVREGNGTIRINSRNLNLIEPRYLQELVREPLVLAGEAGEKLNISIHVEGSGPVSQALAARSCIAKAIVGYSKNDKLREKMMAYDRLLLVDDPRRTEPKKPLGPKARAKKQHSKR